MPFGPYAPEFVLRAAFRPEAPDIYVNSLVDPGTEEVAAFEGLVGCHGGLGGWQDRALCVVPHDLPFPSERVVGADAMHVALRTDPAPPAGTDAQSTTETADRHVVNGSPVAGTGTGPDRESARRTSRGRW